LAHEDIAHDDSDEVIDVLNRIDRLKSITLTRVVSIGVSKYIVNK